MTSLKAGHEASRGISATARFLILKARSQVTVASSNVHTRVTLQLF